MGVFLTLSATSEAGPHGGGFSSGGFHGGFVARSAGRATPHGGGFSGDGFRGGFDARSAGRATPHGGGFSGDGFRGGFEAPSAGPAVRMGTSNYREFAHRRFFFQCRLILFPE